RKSLACYTCMLLVTKGFLCSFQTQKLPSEGRGHRFESCRARHFGTKLGTPKPAVFTLDAATSVRRSALFDPMMRISFASTSTRRIKQKNGGFWLSQFYTELARHGR